MHEALVHRGAVPREKQELIFVRENCVLVHHQCHIDYGQTKEMEKRCLWELAKTVGARYVGRWYKSLWDEHELSVRKGMLIDPKLFKTWQVVSLLEIGAVLNGRDLLRGEVWLLNPGTEHARDYRALCAKRWQGKTIKKIDRPPTQWAGMHMTVMLQLIEDGYWFDYMAGVFGLTAEEIIDERRAAEASIRPV